MLCTVSSFAASELRYGVEAEYPPFESRHPVMFIAELIASNFFATSPGMSASKEVSTQLHFNCAA
jgi:hypothetical protein